MTIKFNNQMWPEANKIFALPVTARGHSKAAIVATCNVLISTINRNATAADQRAVHVGRQKREKTKDGDSQKATASWQGRVKGNDRSQTIEKL